MAIQEAFSDKTYPLLDFSEPSWGRSSGHTTVEWKEIVRAIENSLPLYESVSERISLNLAASLRRKAIARLRVRRQRWILDSGIGPGVSTRMLLEAKFEKIVGLDPSLKLLEYARVSLGEGFCPVLGTAESLPFRDEAFGAVLTCFSLRDARDPQRCLLEYSRVGARQSLLEVVDVGRPDGALRRRFVSFYIKFLMPILARLFARNRLGGNPFRMIIPTFERLMTNSTLASKVEDGFGPVKLQEFLLGGLVVLEAAHRTSVLQR